jgi:hypothetical protein
MLPHVSIFSRRRKPAVETCVDNTANLRPQGIGLGTTSRKRKPAVETCADNTAKLRSQASVLAL